jgi:poly-gamma-glutamate capsule biosynthesis protein CapA/YwtB (metallophosphatase superfamily)
VRLLALVVRAGAVVVVAAVIVAVLVDGAPKPQLATARTTEAQSTRTTTAAVKRKAQPKPKPAYPSGVATIVATGDIVMGSTPNLPPDGGRTFFDDVKTDLAGDVVVGNLEGTLSTVSGSKCGPGSTQCFAFQTPPSYARWLRDAGFTVLNTANNHAFDYGAAGLKQTIGALRKQRLLHSGRPGEIAVQQVGDIRVGLVGFASYPWANNLTDIAGAKRLVAEAAKQADIVVVSAHMGAEGSDKQHVGHTTERFLGENRGNPRRFTHAVIDAGADLVIGHGPHVMRGMEWYRGRLIAYSLGNFAGYRVFSLGGPLSVSGILRVALRGDGAFESGVLVPTRLVGQGMPALDPAERAHATVRSLSREDFGAHAVKVSPTGELR